LTLVAGLMAAMSSTGLPATACACAELSGLLWLLTAPGRRPAGSDSRLPKKGGAIKKFLCLKETNTTDSSTKKHHREMQ
jgi:hypothetical protein